MWCYWLASSYYRRDHASVFRLHDQEGNPVSTYWVASPPWFGNPEEDAAVWRRRFRTPEAAMDAADRLWPEGQGCPSE